MITRTPILAAGLALAVPALTGCVTGLVGFTTPVTVENEPLLAPIPVTDVAADGTLDTALRGRIAFAEGPIDEVTRARVEADIAAGGGVIEVGERTGVVRDDGLPVRRVYIREPQWRCGTPWAQIVVIPIFEDELRRWNRATLVSGERGSD